MLSYVFVLYLIITGTMSYSHSLIQKTLDSKHSTHGQLVPDVIGAAALILNGNANFLHQLHT